MSCVYRLVLCCTVVFLLLGWSAMWERFSTLDQQCLRIIKHVSSWTPPSTQSWHSAASLEVFVPNCAILQLLAQHCALLFLLICRAIYQYWTTRGRWHWILSFASWGSLLLSLLLFTSFGEFVIIQEFFNVYILQQIWVLCTCISVALRCTDFLRSHSPEDPFLHCFTVFTYNILHWQFAVPFYSADVGFRLRAEFCCDWKKRMVVRAIATYLLRLSWLVWMPLQFSGCDTYSWSTWS